jgi:hypothetical protein
MVENKCGTRECRCEHATAEQILKAATARRTFASCEPS